MAIKTKTQLATDITTTVGASYNQTAMQTLLGDVVESYTDLLPQLTTTQRNAISLPAAGLLIYNTTTYRYEYWNGSTWLGVGQNVATPAMAKFTFSVPQMLALHTTPVTLLAAPGAGFALLPTTLAYRFTYGTTAYDFGANLILKCSSVATTHPLATFTREITNAAGSGSGLIACQTDYTMDALVENDAVEFTALSADATTGDGILTIWLTYSVIEY